MLLFPLRRETLRAVLLGLFITWAVVVSLIAAHHEFCAMRSILFPLSFSLPRYRIYSDL